MHAIQQWARRALMVAALLVWAGCEDDYDNDNFSHEPPAGQGTLIVDNQSANDLFLYIDGVRQRDVRDDHHEAFDLLPGIHRVVLDVDDGDGSYANDVDILEGRRTVLGVYGSAYGNSSLDFSIYLD